mmetsp:Transcript_60478/g.129748  ORF Transcript_60478/g.129748 Transcript_60478/m.129748 type:complete len:877 (-) Transcript_60478:84-2714(-)
MSSFLATSSELLLELFSYNRENFKYDRRQRQIMEYELMSMRVEQTGLWREDVRAYSALTPQKMEVYLLVIALELGFCVMALCKARVPPGASPWLVAMHTLSICGALMYLVLALWFGMHAFVSAQAYKVRILTQMVRLPVPTWRALEASRTYASSFEQMKKAQMLRVPFVQTQEKAVAGSSSQESQGTSSPHHGDPEAQDPPQPVSPGGPSAGRNEDEPISSDPWGLERSGLDIQELAPDVNMQNERQRHIWLVREAAKFYKTYDAFCRISMSAGTMCLGTFFAYYSMTYVLTELSAPAAAWAGTMIFMASALCLFKNDLVLPGREYALHSFLTLLSPTLAFVVTFLSSKYHGRPPHWTGIFVIIALGAHGAGLLNYLRLFHVREMQTGAVLPTTWGEVLFIDPFGWANHSGTWLKNLRRRLMLHRGSMRMSRNESSSLGWSSSSGEKNLPSMEFVSGGPPKRPEDLDESTASAPGDRRGPATNPDSYSSSFRPGTFHVQTETEEDKGSSATTGVDIHGEMPGLVPWRVFLKNTLVLSALYWISMAINIYRMTSGGILKWHMPTEVHRYGINDGEVLEIPELLGMPVTTDWDWEAANPHGLACDSAGEWFATSARAPDGRRGVLHGHLSAGSAVRFNGSAAGCLPADGPLQDLSFSGTCSQEEVPGCTALLLPGSGDRLVHCSLDAAGALPKSRPLPQDLNIGRAWLDDRGGVPLDGSHDVSRLYPEELSSLQAIPCPGGGNEACMAVGTTARRVLLLAAHEAQGGGRVWVPRQLLKVGHPEVPGPGALASIDGGRYLGLLHRGSDLFQVMDLHQGGARAGTWRLSTPTHNPHKEAGKTWSAVCSGGGAVYALEDGESPGLWRFPLPEELKLPQLNR